jgi:hypothetical protein
MIGLTKNLGKTVGSTLGGVITSSYSLGKGLFRTPTRARASLMAGAGVYGYMTSSDDKPVQDKLVRALGFTLIASNLLSPQRLEGFRDIAGASAGRWRTSQGFVRGPLGGKSARFVNMKGKKGTGVEIEPEVYSQLRRGKYKEGFDKITGGFNPSNALFLGALYGMTNENISVPGGAALGLLTYGGAKLIGNPKNWVKSYNVSDMPYKARNKFINESMAEKEFSSMAEKAKFINETNNSAAPFMYQVKQNLKHHIPYVRAATVLTGVYGGYAGLQREGDLGGLAKGALIGAGTGLFIAGTVKGLATAPKTTVGILGSAAIIGSSSVQAYQTVQSRKPYDLDADGSLALGLHSLRHGYGI